MENVAPTIPHELWGLDWLPEALRSYQYSTVFMAIVVNLVIVLGAIIWTRRMKMVPGRGQALLEAIVEAFRGLVYATMGPKDGRKYLPLIGTIFLFVWVSNMIGLIPMETILEKTTGEASLYFTWGPFTFIIPGFSEPTRDVNTPWALGIMTFFIMHVAAIARKGPATYFDEYFTPHMGTFHWPLGNPLWRTLAAVVLAAIWAGLAWLVVLASGAEGAWFWGPIGTVGGVSFLWCMVRLSHERRRVGVPNIFMFPLNVIGKFAEILSMSFRLFGNIFGGAIIITLLGSMVNYIVLPIILKGFMGIFVGTIQAFVFAMLALTYITVEIQEDELEEAVEGEDPDAETATAA